MAALEQSAAPARRGVMLGDTPYDVEAALRAGIRIVGVECGGWGAEELGGRSRSTPAPADLCARYDESIFARLGRVRSPGYAGASTTTATIRDGGGPGALTRSGTAAISRIF